MKYVEFEVNTGEKNMQIDSDLLEFAITNQLEEPTFRLYAWSPACVSLGRNQNDEFLDKEFLKTNKIDVVRRLTGGRALLHDKELTYSYICPVASLKCGESVVNSYKEISQFLIDGFAKLGINLQFPEHKSVHTKFDYCMSISTGADLCHNDKKFIGSAQFRKEGYILQHGSILFDYDENLIEKLFGEKICKNSTGENTLTCLSEINEKITLADVKNALVSSIATR